MQLTNKLIHNSIKKECSSHEHSIISKHISTNVSFSFPDSLGIHCNQMKSSNQQMHHIKYKDIM